MPADYPKIAQFKSVAAFRARLEELGVSLPVDDFVLSAGDGSPLAAPLVIGPLTAGNRWCIHPMEGWDANRDGSPSPHTSRRWRRFGQSGAKLIWGGEAAAVQEDGRANPNQTLATPANFDGLVALLGECRAAHRERFGSDDDLVVGLQLTHSGRFSRPNSERLEPRIAYHDPLLDARFGIDASNNSIVWTDDDLKRLIDRFVEAASLAEKAGYQFVDVKACHGYLLHELLGARDRPGRFGGDLDGRSRVLCTIIGRIRDSCPKLVVGVRLSVFDTVPYQSGREVGQPMPFANLLPYRGGFGVSPENPLEPDLTEPILLLKRLCDLGVAAANLSCGCPYYSPHIQRPAFYPPSDGYLPPEDPLVGVARQIEMARQCKQAVSELAMVGSGYSYLQEFLPHVAQAAVRAGWIDSVGLGRMVLAYPEMPADTLSGTPLKRKQVCRTFSDCTTGPRNGMLSGCFPLDDYYKALPEAERLKAVKVEVQSGKRKAESGGENSTDS
jgi:2,4-dienoyl-CoA reductase-like NADH-dependent reductase (Old Yellow Enzyme family)